MYDTKLQRLEPGLFKFSYSISNKPYDELGLKLPPPLSNVAHLPNDVLCYRPFLRLGMKSAWKTGGLQVAGPFDGYEMRDEHIESVAGRVVRLNGGFARQEYNPLLIACNSPAFRHAVDLLRATLVQEGFNVDKSTWDDYKAWEEAKLATF